MVIVYLTHDFDGTLGRVYDDRGEALLDRMDYVDLRSKVTEGLWEDGYTTTTRRIASALVAKREVVGII